MKQENKTIAKQKTHNRNSTKQIWTLINRNKTTSLQGKTIIIKREYSTIKNNKVTKNKDTNYRIVIDLRRLMHIKTYRVRLCYWT